LQNGEGLTLQSLALSNPRADDVVFG